MFARFTLLLALGALSISFVGCRSTAAVDSPEVVLLGEDAGAVTGGATASVASSGSGFFVRGVGLAIGVPRHLRPSLPAGETREFFEPVGLDVHHRTRSPGGFETEARFNAYAVPLPGGGPFSLTLQQSIGDLGAGPLLTITNGAMIVRGRNPAVGGSETGTWGEGTTFILESSDRDYIYLLDDPDGETHALKVYRLSDSAAAVDIIPGTALGEVRGYRWVAPGNTHDPDNQEFVKHGDYRDDPHRRAIHDALRGMLS